MTQLKKKLLTESSELYDIPNIKKKSFYAEFDGSGHLILLDTKDTELIKFAKSKGLK